ncbi:unnamed protein product [Withania somnifera]
MGKRKSKSKPPPKMRMDQFDTVFSCPFCSHGNSVECRSDIKNLSFSTTVTALTEPIDIDCEWIDQCELVNNYEEEDVFNRSR